MKKVGKHNLEEKFLYGEGVVFVLVISFVQLHFYYKNCFTEKEGRRTAARICAFKPPVCSQSVRYSVDPLTLEKLGNELQSRTSR